jgi:hypothetical protein
VAAQPSTEGLEAVDADVIACSLGPNSFRWRMTCFLSETIDFVTTQTKDGAEFRRFGL